MVLMSIQTFNFVNVLFEKQTWIQVNNFTFSNVCIRVYNQYTIKAYVWCRQSKMHSVFKSKPKNENVFVCENWKQRV